MPRPSPSVPRDKHRECAPLRNRWDQARPETTLLSESAPRPCVRRRAPSPRPARGRGSRAAGEGDGSWHSPRTREQLAEEVVPDLHLLHGAADIALALALHPLVEIVGLGLLGGLAFADHLRAGIGGAVIRAVVDTTE